MMVDNNNKVLEDKLKLNQIVIKNIKNRKAKIFFIKNPIESWIVRLSVPIFLLAQI